MSNDKIEFEFENEHLKYILELANIKLASSYAKQKEKNASLQASIKEVWDESSHFVSGHYTSMGFEDLVELSQYSLAAISDIEEKESGERKLFQLNLLVNSPYFARIDFKFEGDDYAEKIYIGRFSFRDDDTHDMYIYDWRAPISSMFYRFTSKAAFYEAPAGRIYGELSLKRQFEIKNSTLEYFFDSDVQIVDEFLRKILSNNTSAKMKTIVETIQKDQDIAIRDLDNDLLMIQGVAGSGKTSVGLHRVVFLMYKGLSSKLSHNNVVIISPNHVFENYISEVIPSLGERNVVTFTFDDLIHTVLKREFIEGKNDFLERMMCCDKAHETLVKNSIHFKTSTTFATILERYINDISHKFLEFEDVYYNNMVLFDKHVLKSRAIRLSLKMPLGTALVHLEAYILEEVRRSRKERVEKLVKIISKGGLHRTEIKEYARMISIFESTKLIKKIRKYTKIDCLNLYRELFKNKEYFKKLSFGLTLPENIDDIIDLTNNSLIGDILAYDDACPLTLFTLKVHGYNEFKNIKQTVIDESQDYYPIHFMILNSIFPDSRYTILGDVAQTIGKSENISFYEEVSSILNKKNSALVRMNKSFRCTKEILDFAQRFNDAHIEYFNREGKAPSIYRASDDAELFSLLSTKINDSISKGYRSIGLLCKSATGAKKIYEHLKETVDISIIDEKKEVRTSGAFVMPIYLSKGLEFDSILLCDADEEHYYDDDDKNLLYIACTRALHELNIFYIDKPSRFL